MPTYRHSHTAEVIHATKGSPRDKDLAASDEWQKTPDRDSDKEAAKAVRSSPDKDAHTSTVTEHEGLDVPTGADGGSV